MYLKTAFSGGKFICISLLRASCLSWDNIARSFTLSLNFYAFKLSGEGPWQWSALMRILSSTTENSPLQWASLQCQDFHFLIALFFIDIYPSNAAKDAPFWLAIFILDVLIQTLKWFEVKTSRIWLLVTVILIFRQLKSITLNFYQLSQFQAVFNTFLSTPTWLLQAVWIII